MDIERLTEQEAEHLLDIKHKVLTASPKGKHQIRREIRRRLFRILQGRVEFDNGLSKMFEAQLEGGQSLEQFTHSWDVAPDDPTEVVQIHDWSARGGDFETVLMPDPKTGIVKQRRICKPTAFTGQEI